MSTTFQITNGDVIISDATGRTVMLQDGRKLSQDIKETLSTEIRTDNIGAGLDDVINGMINDVFGVKASVSRRIRTALDSMLALQNRIQLSERPTDERIRSITSLIVAPFENSSTDYTFRVTVSTAAGTQTTVSGVIT